MIHSPLLFSHMLALANLIHIRYLIAIDKNETEHIWQEFKDIYSSQRL